MWTIVRAGTIQATRSTHYAELLRDVVEGAHDGWPPAVGDAVAHASEVVQAVALPCGMATLFTPFPVVSRRAFKRCP